MWEKRLWWWFETDTHCWRHTGLYYNLANDYPYWENAFLSLVQLKRVKNITIPLQFPIALHRIWCIRFCAKFSLNIRGQVVCSKKIQQIQTFAALHVQLFSILIFALCPSIETVGTNHWKLHTFNIFLWKANSVCVM